jgi:MSHA biogenesis protein MshN
MSLINKMLKDLEARQGSGLRHDARPIFHDLQPVAVERRRRHLVIGAVVLVAAVAAGVYAWQRPTGVPVVSALPANPAPPTPSPAEPVAASAPVPSPTPVPAPAATPAVTPPVAVAKPTAVKPAAEPKAASAPKARAPEKKAPAAAKETAPPEPARIEKVERKPSSEELAEQTYRDAARAHTGGNPAEAERSLKALLSSTPKHTKARELLAGIQLDGGRWLEAQDTLEQGVTLVPEHLPFRYSLARLYLEHGSAAQAEKLLEDARRAGHTDPELHAFLAALQQRGGRHAEAAKSYREALALRPEEGRWWLGLGISLEAQQEGASAQEAYRRALGSGRLAANLARYAEDRLKALTTR